METIQLTAKEASRLYKGADANGKQLLEEKFGTKAFQVKDITELIQTVKDACEYNGTVLEEITPFKNPVTDQQKSVNAYAQLCEVIKAFNEGGKKDWRNSSQYKHYAWFRMDGKSGSGLSFSGTDFDYSFSIVSSRLCLLNEEHVPIVAKRFLSLYEDYMTE